MSENSKIDSMALEKWKLRKRLLDETMNENKELLSMIYDTEPQNNIKNCMYKVTYEDELFRQYDSKFMFRSYVEAKLYLLKHGYTESNRVFVRENYGWSIYTKAYIELREVF